MKLTTASPNSCLNNMLSELISTPEELNECILQVEMDLSNQVAACISTSGPSYEGCGSNKDAYPVKWQTC